MKLAPAPNRKTPRGKGNAKDNKNKQKKTRHGTRKRSKKQC
jgi:hypothetical protein